MVSDDEYSRARKLILEFGWNATAYQILNPGIDLWFPSAGDGVVGFVRYRRTVVVGGAPVCALQRLETIASEFVAAARQRRCRVCYFGAGERLESHYAGDREWSRVLLGAQPVWDPRRWSEAVSTRASLRAQFNRARNKEIVVSEWQPDEAESNPALRRCLKEWLSTRRLPPLHFMVEPETLSQLHDRRIFVAEPAGREAVAFTVLSPVPARNGWLVEQIVRGTNAPNGTVELLIDTAMRAIGTSGAN